MKNLFIILLLSLSFRITFGQNTLNLDKSIPIDNFEKHILLLEDKNRSLKPENIIAGKHDDLFKNPPSRGMNFGLSNSNFWIKFKLKNPNFSQKSGILLSQNEWFLQNAYSTIDSLVLYHQSRSGENTQGIAGGRVIKRKHLYRYNLHVFPIQLNDNEVHTFYLKINTIGPANIALNLSNAYNFEQNAFLSQLFYGLFFGSLTIMMLYNLFIYTVVRKISYLYYCFYIFFYLLSQFANSGHGFNYVWGHSVPFEKLVLLFCVHIDIVFIALFSFSFLDIKTSVPRLYKYYKYILGYCIFSVLGLFFIPFKLYILMTILWTFTSTTLSFILGAYVWYKGRKYAKYYVLGWTTFLIGLGILNLKNAGLIPDAFILHHIHQIGAVIEILFFSIALADQINVYRAEKEMAQAESIRVSKENERILAEQNKILEQKVRERTQELENTQEEVLAQNEEIIAKSEEIIAKSQELTHAYQDIKASINYAKNIQTAMLPPVEDLKEFFSNSFIFFKPRDVVSGDFYWFSRVEDKIIVAAIDCTGHGVPGAFMSLISNDLLTEVIINRKHYQADVILNKIHKGIRNILKQKDGNNRDGMDIALCVIDQSSQTIEFAGAKNPLVYIQNNEIFHLKGNIFPIGGEQKEVERLFTKHTIRYEKGAKFYLFSDGFQDQFGGLEDRKFGIKRMKQLLLNIHQQQMAQQQSILEDTIIKWADLANEKQIDDVLIIGFEV